MFGDPGAIRTLGLQLRRLLLYPAELRDHEILGCKDTPKYFATSIHLGVRKIQPPI
jgi:hypothetical protein